MKKIYIFIAMPLLFTLASCGLEEKEVIMEDTSMMEQTEDVMMEKDMMQEISGEETMMKEDVIMEQTEDAMMEKDMIDKSEDETMMQETLGEDAMMEKSGEDMMAKGSYTAYSTDMLGKTENTVVFFHANWCPSCRAADSGISSGIVPENLTILKADYDSETELKKKYGVVSQHTFVLVDAQGEMIKKWVGGTSVQDIVEKL